MRARYIIGIDEVGRGPLAGPVVIAAVCIPANFRLPAKYGPVRDSKQLPEALREQQAAYLRAHPQVQCVFARVSPSRIDKLNIARAANRAAGSALRRLALRHNINLKEARIILDGGLYIGNREEQRRYSARTLPKADERFPAVAFASVLAKVHRDRYMRKQAKRYPEYGFEEHKGYGTLRHRRALKKYGATPLHRLTFAPVSRSI